MTITALIGVLISTATAMGEAPGGVPVEFTLEKPGYVTLVVDDVDGKRVANVIADTFFEAGRHTIRWDGYDVGQARYVKEDNKTHKYYDVERHLVEPGQYRLHGLVHDDIQLRYELSIQSPGTPPWKTADRTGMWLADHTPPCDVLSLPDGSPYGERPQVLVTAPTGEAGYSAMWLTLDGEKLYSTKMRGWRSPKTLTRDPGDEPNDDYYAFGILQGRLYGLRRDADLIDRPDAYDEITNINAPEDRRERDWNWMRMTQVQDCAAWNGLVLVSYPLADRIVVLDSRKSGKAAQVGEIEVADPRGLDFDERGRLFVVAGNALLRFDSPDIPGLELGAARTIVHNLADPNRVMVGPDGALYVSETGASHQVKVYTADGRHLRTMGKPGGPITGHYDEQRMSHPSGMAFDAEGKLWVAEMEYMPKRISVWDAGSGEFIRAYYGPPKYGGGGRFDPRDRTKYYYGVGTGTIEFTIDWETGDYTVSKIPFRSGAMVNNSGGGGPEQVVYDHQGRRYLASRDNLYRMQDDGTLRIIASNGMTGKHHKQLQQFMHEHPELKLKDERGRNLNKKYVFVSWSDLNGDQQYQPDEIKTTRSAGWMGVHYQDGLSLRGSRGIAVDEPAFRDGVPVWDLSTHRMSIEYETVRYVEPGQYGSNYSGSYVYLPEANTEVTTRGPIIGWKNGECAWVYHSQWPMRGTRFDPVPQFTGQLIATAGIIGRFNPAAGDAGPSFVLNNDRGSIYLFTADGLYLTDLGGDGRTHPRLNAPKAVRGMIVDDVSWGEELFGPAVSQIKGEQVYLMTGHPSTNVFEILGLHSVRRLPAQTVEVTAAMLADQPETHVMPADPRERRETTVPIAADAPRLDGRLDDWAGADWLAVDRRLDIRATMRIAGETLYAAWRTNDPNLLNNSAADGRRFAFASGGGLDLMFRTNPAADAPKRLKHYAHHETATEGDVRLFVTRVGDPSDGRVLAVRFQQVGGPGEAVSYTSPVGRVDFDSVQDVSGRVRLAQADGAYELAVPLKLLNLKPTDGATTLGDIGVVIGDGSEARARLYWNNKAANMVADIPTEARLLPQEWGTLRFEAR